MLYNAPVSAGDLLDRISILAIKEKRLPAEKAAKSAEERQLLMQAGGTELMRDGEVWNLYKDLQDINEILWDVENNVRAYHRAKNYGLGFVQEARKVAPNNDQRAKIKLEINQLVGSDIVEMKSHDL